MDKQCREEDGVDEYGTSFHRSPYTGNHWIVLSGRTQNSFLFFLFFWIHIILLVEESRVLYSIRPLLHAAERQFKYKTRVEMGSGCGHTSVLDTPTWV